MTPLSVSLALPWLALTATLLALGGAIVLGRRASSLGGRPILLAAMALGALPLVYVELVWARLLPERYLRVERPALALVAAIAVVFVALRLATLSPRMHRGRRLLVELLLSLSALAAGAAAMGLELGRPLDKLTILLAVDRSRSIDLVPGADARLRAELDVVERGMREDDRVAVIVFAADAMTEDPPRPKSEARGVQRAEIGRDATDLGAAIRRALAEVPPDTAARIILLTDGVATRGDALQAAAAAVAAEIPIDVVPLEQRVVPDVRLVALRMPSRADEREPLELRIVTSSGSPADVELRVKRDGVLIKKATAKILGGEDVLRIKEIAPSPGLHRYDVEITALDPKLDQAPEDNSGSAFVRVRGPSAALVIEGEAGKGVFLEKALTDAGFRVESAGASGVPADLAALAAYDLVVFSDVRASDIAPTQIEALASYARDLGGGLLLMGGDRSMGPGGYAKSALDDVAPVSFDLKQERRRASLAEVISIDYSGSMGARVGAYTKLDLANEAAARSAMLLGPGDRLGVAHVDTKNSWTVPLGPVTDAAAVARAIKAVKVGGGGIYVDLALDEGYRALDGETVNLRHLLLFSDGNDAERLPGCRAKVTAARSRGITTSVVALGKGSDTTELEVLSKLGDGRFYLIEDATRLPSVFAQETILASRSAIHEIDFRPSVGAPGAALRGVDFGEAPILKGYVVTIAKPRASVHLVGPEGDPILATWSVGVGRTAVFTSDLKDRWGAAWTTWPGAARVISQLARDLSRKADDPRVRLESDAAGGELHIRATVVGDDGRAQTFRRLAVVASGPDGFTRTVPLEPIGAGAYAASVPLSRPGTYVATAVDELSRDVVGTTGAVLTAGEELRPTGTDRVLLQRIATMTGGKVRDTLAGAFLDRAVRRFAYTELGAGLALVAATALLLGVAARKLAFPEVLARAAKPGEKRARAARPAPTPIATADALLRAKARADDRAAAETHSLGRRDGPAEASGPATLRPPPSARPPAAGEGRKLTAAEILLARRRGQRGPDR